MRNCTPDKERFGKLFNLEQAEFLLFSSGNDTGGMRAVRICWRWLGTAMQPAVAHRYATASRRKRIWKNEAKFCRKRRQSGENIHGRDVIERPQLGERSIRGRVDGRRRAE
jgi:hypothetical protein